jgi:serine beta-lactamase-like protein LACTB
MKDCFIRTAIAVAAFILCVACSSLSSSHSDAFIERSVSDEAVEEARAKIASAREETLVPAISISVWRDDGVIWSEAFGTADLEHNVPATRDSLFRIGSISKALTASLAARLSDEGLINLDADIREVLPSFPDKGAIITLRQLLGHLGGIRHYKSKDYDFNAPGGMIDTRPYPDDESILAIFANDMLVAPPGEKFNYTTFGYTLVGLVLEAATGRDYYDLLNEYVLLPAGVETVVIDQWFEIIPNRVDYYDPISGYEGYLPPELGPVVNSSPLNSAYKRPGGGLIATADDLVKIGAMHFEPGFLSEAMFAQVFTSQKDAAGKETGTGLGWRIGADDKGRLYYHHRGSQMGCRAYLIVYPEERVAVAVLSNLANTPGDIIERTQEIATLFLPEQATP